MKRICNRCNHQVTKSKVKGYEFSCPNCDEDLYDFETHEVSDEEFDKLNDDGGQYEIVAEGETRGHKYTVVYDNVAQKFGFLTDDMEAFETSDWSQAMFSDDNGEFDNANDAEYAAIDWIEAIDDETQKLSEDKVYQVKKHVLDALTEVLDRNWRFEDFDEKDDFIVAVADKVNDGFNDNGIVEPKLASLIATKLGLSKAPNIFFQSGEDADLPDDSVQFTIKGIFSALPEKEVTESAEDNKGVSLLSAVFVGFPIPFRVGEKFMKSVSEAYAPGDGNFEVRKCISGGTPVFGFVHTAGVYGLAKDANSSDLVFKLDTAIRNFKLFFINYPWENDETEKPDLDGIVDDIKATGYHGMNLYSIPSI